MRTLRRHSGFSLVEVLMAAGILAIGFMLILGTFPVGVHLTTKATERSIGSVAANEAFAKIQMYGVDFTKIAVETQQYRFDFHRYDSSGYLDISKDSDDLDKVNISYVVDSSKDIYSLEKFYPSSEDIDKEEIKYVWSALCRQADSDTDDLLTTVFVSRKSQLSTTYPKAETSGGDYGKVASGSVRWPEPIKVPVQGGLRNNLLNIELSEKDLILKGSYIVDDVTSQIYHVVDRFQNSAGWHLELNRDWDLVANNPAFVWVIPPAIGSSKSPCIGVYQRVLYLPKQ